MLYQKMNQNFIISRNSIIEKKMMLQRYLEVPTHFPYSYITSTSHKYTLIRNNIILIYIKDIKYKIEGKFTLL